MILNRLFAEMIHDTVYYSSQPKETADKDFLQDRWPQRRNRAEQGEAERAASDAAAAA